MLKEITSEDYVSRAIRTDTPITMELVARLTDPDFIRLLHAGMGLCTESGEFMDMLKRHLIYGKPLDYVNAREELGDQMWYTALAIDVIRTTLDEVMTVNINKLKLRYPEKFSEACAIDRDVDAERELLEITKQYDYKDLARALTSGVRGKSPVASAYDCKCPCGKEEIIQHGDDSGSCTGKGCETRTVSERAKQFQSFAHSIVSHIEQYTVPQYGDAPNDQMSEWTIEECLKAVSKRLARYGRQSREGQQELDFKKMAHEIQIAATKFQEAQNVVG